jgi:hypothetical protein
MVIFGRPHLGKRGLEPVPVAQTVGPRFGQFHQISPLVGPRTRTRKKLVDMKWTAINVLNHLVFSDVGPPGSLSLRWRMRSWLIPCAS